MSANEKLKTREFSRRGLLGIGLGIGAAALVGCGDKTIATQSPTTPEASPVPSVSKTPETSDINTFELSKEEQSIVDRLALIKSIDEFEKESNEDRALYATAQYIQISEQGMYAAYLDQKLAHSTTSTRSLASHSPVDRPLGLNASVWDICYQTDYTAQIAIASSTNPMLEGQSPLDEFSARKMVSGAAISPNGESYKFQQEEITSLKNKGNKTGKFSEGSLNYGGELEVIKDNYLVTIDGKEYTARDILEKSDRNSDGTKGADVLSTYVFIPQRVLGKDKGLWINKNNRLAPKPSA